MEEDGEEWRWNAPNEWFSLHWPCPSSLQFNKMNECMFPPFFLLKHSTIMFFNIDYALSKMVCWAQHKKSNWLKRAPCAKRVCTWQLTSHVTSDTKRSCHAEQSSHTKRGWRIECNFPTFQFFSMSFVVSLQKLSPKNTINLLALASMG